MKTDGKQKEIINNILQHDYCSVYEIPNLLRYMQNNAKGFHQYVAVIDVGYQFDTNHSAGQQALIIRTFAFKETKNGLLYTEVIRQAPGTDLCLTRNMYLASMSGWRVVFDKKQCKRISPYNYYSFYEEDYDKWFREVKAPGIFRTVLNPEKIETFEGYKYASYSGKGDVYEYLNAFLKNPQVEYFGKLGIRYSKKLADKVKKDKGFVKFLMENADAVNTYGPESTIRAYERNISLSDASDQIYEERSLISEIRRSCPTAVRFKLKYQRVKEYLDEQKKSYWIYDDYLRALERLGYDFEDTKNIYPRDLQRMHDLRIQELNALEAKEDARKKRELCRLFRKKAKELQKYAFESGEYIVVIPHEVKDLVAEGEALKHCVGRMGYDKKMADGLCIIAFVRKKDNPEVPLVTVEFLMKSKKVSQRYGINDSTPSDEVIAFVDEWEKYVRGKTA